MFDIGTGELVFIVLVIVLLFGPKRLPEMAKQVSNGMQKVKKARAQFTAQMSHLNNELKRSVEDEERKILTELEPVKKEVEKVTRDQSF